VENNTWEKNLENIKETIVEFKERINTKIKKIREVRYGEEKRKELIIHVTITVTILCNIKKILESSRKDNIIII